MSLTAIWACPPSRDPALAGNSEHATARRGAPPACSAVAITIVAATIKEHEIICAGVLRSIALFRQCKLETPDRVRIVVANVPLKIGGISAFAVYEANTKTIHLANMKTFAAAAKSIKEFGALPIDALYESVVAHEVAHRIFRPLVKNMDLSHATHEYVAYAAQVSAMPRAVRRQYLQSIERPPPTDLSLFVDIVLLLGPARFAAMAYDHFSAPGNGCRILQGVAAGSIEFPTMEEFD
ncbi:MAG: hypothetical protein KJ622_14470 [Alphaproteobacteria bacterium]|nr:hypothetical protein [Alphaproteobacteria bacterium]